MVYDQDISLLIGSADKIESVAELNVAYESRNHSGQKSGWVRIHVRDQMTLILPFTDNLKNAKEKGQGKKRHEE